MRKGLSLAIDSPSENASRGSKRRLQLDVDDEDAALIDDADLQIDGGNFFTGQGHKSKEKAGKVGRPTLDVLALQSNQNNSEEYYNESESDNSRIRNPELASECSEDD